MAEEHMRVEDVDGAARQKLKKKKKKREEDEETTHIFCFIFLLSYVKLKDCVTFSFFFFKSSLALTKPERLGSDVSGMFTFE